MKTYVVAYELNTTYGTAKVEARTTQEAIIKASDEAYPRWRENKEAGFKVIKVKEVR